MARNDAPIAPSGARKGEGGFTLLEVMISLAVLAGVVVTVLATTNYHLDVAAGDGDLVRASLLGRTRVEEMALSALPTQGEGEFVDEGGEAGRGGGGEGGGGFRWSLELEDTELPELRRVTLKVMWDDDREVDFISYRRVD